MVDTAKFVSVRIMFTHQTNKISVDRFHEANWLHPTFARLHRNISAHKKKLSWGFSPTAP